MLTKKQVSEWFQTCHEDDNISPAISIMRLNDSFIDWLHSNNLSVYNKTEFRKSMCGALCTLKLTGDLQISEFPNKNIRDLEWKNEFNELWEIYLQKILTTDVINKIFSNVPESCWEHSLENWRIIIGSILRYYIKPSIETLEHEGFIVNDEEHDYISYEDIYESDNTNKFE